MANRLKNRKKLRSVLNIQNLWNHILPRYNYLILFDLFSMSAEPKWFTEYKIAEPDTYNLIFFNLFSSWEIQPMKGFVYIMSNEAMPGIYKIGCTSRPPEERASDLYTTGVPKPFVVEYCIFIENYENIEKLTHKSLMSYNYNKEFFKYDLTNCILELKMIAHDHYTYQEKYRTQHLRSIVEGWEKKYLEEKARSEESARQEEERRIRLKEEQERRQKEIAEREWKIRREKEERERIRWEEESKRTQKEANKGCIIMAVCFIIGATISENTHSIWPLLISCGIGLAIIFDK